MSNYTDKLAEVKSYTVYALQDMADCTSPDTRESAGAVFLSRVRDDMVEHVEDIAPEDFQRETEETTWEVADSAVPIYTGEKWATFTDLGAYAEDVSELAGESGDMDHLGSVALYIIAERLAQAIRIELMDAIDEDSSI